MVEPDDPLVVNVVGRHKERENQDLQGEYHMQLGFAKRNLIII